jgi:diphthamide synthase (EF-2-diphthine--ammonia ligase)
MEEMVTPPGNAPGIANTAVLLSWSGGKDSCLTLYEIQRAQSHRVAALLTTVTRDYDRISMHGVRRALLEKQATSLRLPLHQVLISKDATNEEYEAKMGEAFSVYRGKGIDSIVFGDLFLEDVRAYREQFRTASYARPFPCVEA